MKRPRLSSSLPGRLRILKPKRTPPGAAPGAINIAADALAPRLFITTYSTETLRETPVDSLAEILNIVSRFPDCTHWIELKGFGDKPLMESFCHEFGIHRLEMEDVINTYQRPKLEETDDHLFVVSRFLKVSGDGLCTNEQLSLFLFNNMIITFQEHYEDFFDPVRSRLRTGKGHLRSSGVDYMAYALLDAVVDTYFPLLEQQGDLLDQLEDELFTNPSRSSLQKIQAAKRTLIVFRRTVFAERDKVNDILRTSSRFINDATKVFFRDTYDHTIQVMDLVESYKEITASLMEIYLSSVSNRLNQIMKVLAIISTIFIPLTFIVGVYGMNFAVEDPRSGEELPWNMPELYMPLGYAGVMLFMLAIVIVQLIIFWRKGWLSDR